MKRWHIVMSAAVGLLVISFGWRALAADGKESGEYVFAEVVRTDLHATSTSTGTLSAVEALDVGTQISGQVEEVLVDFNDVVEQGQLLAVIDTEALDATLEDARARVTQAEAQRAQAEAQLVEAKAQFADAQATLERNAPLAERGYLSQSEMQPLRTAVQTAEAGVRRAEASLRASDAQVAQARAQVTKALKDRSNAEIRAPIGGIVIERTIEEGQTVAASFETPTLFVLARNLEQMQILTDVDESDIGQIRQGQTVTFTVPAYPDIVYDGVVREVRLQPKAEQNVVTYTVVVDAENVDGRLLPGMTATVDFVTGEASDVLAVPTAALQLQPTEEMAAKLTALESGREWERASSTGAAPAERPGTGRIWIMDDASELRPVAVRVGFNAGALTQIEPAGPEAESLVRPGLRVVEQVLADEPQEERAAARGPRRM